MVSEATRASRLDAVDVTQTRPRLREGLRVFPKRNRSGKPWFRIEDPVTRRFHRIGVAEYEFLLAIDGHNTVDQCRDIAARATKQANAISSQQAESLVLRASHESLINGRRITPEPITQGRSLTWITFPLFRSDHDWQSVVRIAGPLFNRSVVCVVLKFWVAAWLLVIANQDRFGRDLGAVLQPGTWLTFVCVWCGLKCVHELGHLVCCVKKGLRVGDVGVPWMLITPVACADLTDVYRMRSLSDRIFTCLAGMYFKLIVAAAAVLFWWQTDSPAVAHVLVTIVVSASVATMLFS